MAVCSLDGATRLTTLDKGYWNVVSIHGPRERKAHLPLAKTIHYACFDDVEDEYYTLGRGPKAADVAAIFSFIGSLSSGPPLAPLLIHCQQGLSRSTAVALSWIYGHLPPNDDRLLRAIDLTLELRPQAKPNRLVLALGLAQLMEVREARQLADRMSCDPRLKQNRFQISQEE
jgi:predicted protein tyrosine phosphatase